jgi:hypothetical protein
MIYPAQHSPDRRRKMGLARTDFGTSGWLTLKGQTALSAALACVQIVACVEACRDDRLPKRIRLERATAGIGCRTPLDLRSGGQLSHQDSL